MKTISQLRAAVLKAGGTLEEDTGYRDMRVLQLVAPKGKLWSGADVQSYPVHWAKGNSTHAVEYNERNAFADAMDTINHGLRDMTEDEKPLYDEGEG
jgi:hypothetical protein